MKHWTRKVVLVAAAAGLVASVVAGRERPAIELVEPAARIDTRIRAGEELDLSGLERRQDEGAGTDLFASRSFAPPEAKPKAKASVAKPETPPKPSAPPLPFAYVGKVLEEGKLSVFLARGTENLSVSAGDTIGEYRVDAVTENEIQFTYLPLKTKQSLPL